jgi:hypothetical protein
MISSELNFLPDPASATSVQSNLPLWLTKLNEVYYWGSQNVRPARNTNVAVGLATKPYPHFRLPGHCRYSVAYRYSGDKTYNYPFTATPLAPSLKEWDVIAVGYQPRSGTVFFTRNGCKLELRLFASTVTTLFPTIRADGPCSLHVDLKQGGFVFIEANVKKSGLAPSVGILPPSPAYGNERGSILLKAGAGVSPPSVESTSIASCAASETVVIFHQPTFLFTRRPTATYPHRPLAWKGPFRIIAIALPIRDRTHTTKLQVRTFIRPPRRQKPSDYDRRPDSELASSRSNTCSPRFAPALPVTRPRQTIATTLCRRCQARRYRRQRADPRRRGDGPPAYWTLIHTLMVLISIYLRRISLWR